MIFLTYSVSANLNGTLVRKYLKKHKSWKDFAKWISNGIKEFEKINDVELHVVSPYYGVSKVINF